MTRKIIHLDLDAFFCAVEEKRDPSLKGKPFAVGGHPDHRGVVSSSSYAARQFGVRSAMPMARALRLCPDLEIISPHFPDYSAASQEVMTRLKIVTPLVEQISIDEAFLDVSDLPEPVETIAQQLQSKILAELSLPCSLGVATNKLVAKIATDVGKEETKTEGPPNAITFVQPGTEAEFLADLPVRRLWGIGPKTAARLKAMGVEKIGELASFDKDELAKQFGKHGEDMARRSRGIDTSPVVTARKAKSFSQEVTFSRDVKDQKKLRDMIEKQAGILAHQLQKRDLTATTVKIKIRWPNFKTLTRQTTLGQPFDEKNLISETAWQLMQKVWKPGKLVRLLGVGVTGLDSRPKQLSLWDLEDEEKEYFPERMKK